MIKKTYQKDRKRCVVTFYVKDDSAQKVDLVGEWNGWKPEPMRRKKDGTFWLSKRLEVGKSYRFKYLIDGWRWKNECFADGEVPNPFGTTDSLIVI